MSTKVAKTTGGSKPSSKHSKPTKPGAAKALMPKKPGKPKKRNKPKQPGKPKKKSAKQRQEAQQRAAELSAIGWIEDRHQRRIADSCFQRRYIKAELLAKEGGLQQSKWVEYRYMTPLEATERFAHEYIAAYRRVYARHFDAKVAANKQAIYANFGQNSKAEITSLWIARQYADERGIPYDVFLDIVMEGWVGGGKARQPPLPCQLLSSAQTAARLRMRPTREEVTERLFQPHWDRRFYAGRSIDDPVRAAALRGLRIDVLRAEDRPQRLAKYLGIRGLLSEVSARTMFDASLVDAAVALKPAIHRVSPVVPVEDYLPACMGNRNVAPDSPCQACPVTRDCMRMKGEVTRTLIKTTGSGDPRLAHKRQLERERQQKWRANKKKEALIKAGLGPDSM